MFYTAAVLCSLKHKHPDASSLFCDSCQRPVSERFSENSEYFNPEMKETLGYRYLKTFSKILTATHLHHRISKIVNFLSETIFVK